MSQRKTRSTGYVANQLVEFDPSRANTGTETPYTGTEPEPEDLEPIYQMLADAPLTVNGMPAQCYRDGIRYSGDCRELLAQVGHAMKLCLILNASQSLSTYRV